MRFLTTAPAILTSLSVAVLLTACGGGSSKHDFTQPYKTEPTATHGPIFDPANGNIPTTNDLLFAGSKDGTLNIPNTGNNPLIAAANELDGFSTSIPITADFGMSLDPNSLILGNTVRVFEVVKNAAGAVLSVTRELTAADIMLAPTGADLKTLALIPRKPLKESTSYLVALNNGIKGSDGLPAQAPSTYSIAKSSTLAGTDYAALAPLGQLIANMEAIAVSQGIDKNKIILTWSFTTQSITPVLSTLAANATAGKIVVAPTGKTTNDILALFPGIADVSIGTLDVPYYLEIPSTANPTAAKTGHWQGAGGSPLTRINTTPVANSTLTIPVMMTTPNANSGKTMPTAGWPIVIYQHGITRVRTDMLGYADAMAQAGFAVIAIDLPLHGITDSSNPFHASNTPFPNDVEPTFGIDYLDNTTGAAVPDGIVDASGDNFINLTSLLTSRDNIRQGVSNLLVLRQSLKNIPNIDASRVGFVAHSLGGIIGVPFLGVETKSMPTSLVTTGASISTILKDSATYGPIVKGGLAALGVTGDNYSKFLLGSQWILDSADPVNYAMNAADIHPIHMIEVVGDGSKDHPADLTVPNSSTEILASVLGATAASDSVNTVSIGSPRIVRFTQGNHSSILDPTKGAPAGTTYLNVYTEMHSQLVKFQASNGTAVVISDKSIIK
ncbi:MAG: lipase [Aquificaceae bacterium]|nr:MAG: lipase [Aquificaceae bacterium]